jgi:hypothetical protein
LKITNNLSNNFNEADKYLTISIHPNINSCSLT